MSLGKFLKSVEDRDDMVFIQNTIGRALPCGKLEKFKRSFDQLLGDAYRAGSSHSNRCKAKEFTDTWRGPDLDRDQGGESPITKHGDL